MGDRVIHRAGDALTDDLGSDAYDLVFLSAVVHHFDEDTNQGLMRRIDGTRSPDEVHDHIRAVIATLRLEDDV